MSECETIVEKILRLAGLNVIETNIPQSLTFLLEKCSAQLPNAELKRLQPFFYIQTKTLTIDECNFQQEIEKIKVLDVDEKDSASDSFILFGELALRKPGEVWHTKIAIKMAFLPSLNAVGTTNSLQVERDIYKTIINPMIMCGFTPHVAAYCGELTCDNFTEVMTNNIANKSKVMKKIAQELQSSEKINPNGNLFPPFVTSDDVEKPEYDINKMRASITERLSGKKLGEIFAPVQYEGKSDEDIQKLHATSFSKYLPLLFQVFYTLAVFGEIGLVHNDLHTGNVFCEKYPNADTYCYLVQGKLFRITGLQARIFDFDRAAKTPTKFNNVEFQNQKLIQKACAQVGQCQNSDQRSEVYRLCAFIYNGNKINKQLTDFLAKIVPIDLLQRRDVLDDKEAKPGETLAYVGALCTCNDVECTSCTVLHDNRIKTPVEILMLPEFEKFVIKPEEVGSLFIWTLPSEAVNNPAQRFKDAGVQCMK